MEISTRLTLLRIALIVFIGIAIFTVAADYFVLDSVLIKSAEKNLSLAASKTSERIASFVRPMTDRTILAASLIKNGNITPGFSPVFVNFLHDIIGDAPAIFSCLYADIDGNLFEIERNKDQFFNANILRTNNTFKVIENTFDNQMNLISSKTINDYSIDPRSKPWYQQAVYKKDLAWYVFPLGFVPKQEPMLSGATVIPVYDKLGNLRGVFGVAATLRELGESIRNIEVLPESVVMVVDENGLVMTAYLDKRDLVGLQRMPQLAELNIPWLESALNEYKQNKQSSFIFTYNKKKYLANFTPIPQTQLWHQWLVGIVTPVSDITLPSKINIFLLLVLAIGVLIVIIISAKLMSTNDD